MVEKRQYKDIDDTLRALRVQVKDSLPYASKIVPDCETPSELWEWLKPKLIYRNDPRNTELLQTMQTLFGGKFWGIRGAGDCDCFVISTLASAICQGWKNLFIVLVAREPKTPVHIYTCIYWNGKRKVLDFTNRRYNQERDSYKYKQEIPVRYETWRDLNFN